MLLQDSSLKERIVDIVLEHLGDKPTMVFYDIRDKIVATLRLTDPPFTKTDVPGTVALNLKDTNFVVKHHIPRYAVLTSSSGQKVYTSKIGFSHGFNGYDSDAEIILLGKPSRGCTISIDYITLTLAS